MKLITYRIDQKERVGVLSQNGEWVIPVQALGLEYSSMFELIEGMSDSEGQLLAHAAKKEPCSIPGTVELKEVKLLPPIPVPKQDIICLGLNYMEHAKESAQYKKEAFTGTRSYAVYFSKRVNRTVGDGEMIPSHRKIVKRLDYEVELAVIIGKDAKDLAPEQVKDYIFGYTIINDISARDIQTNHQQWYFGKSLDGFTPMGPCITTADALPYPPALGIRSLVNGEVRQDSNTGWMIFDIDHIVSELSQGVTLKAGTIISTGTPEGVGMGFVPPKFLKSGDVVECIIEGIGRIKNIID